MTSGWGNSFVTAGKRCVAAAEKVECGAVVSSTSRHSAAAEAVAAASAKRSAASRSGVGGDRGISWVGVADGQQGRVVGLAGLAEVLVDEAQLLDEAAPHDRVVAVEAEREGLAVQALLVELDAQGRGDLRRRRVAAEAAGQLGPGRLHPRAVDRERVAAAGAQRRVQGEEQEPEGREVDQGFGEHAARHAAHHGTRARRAQALTGAAAISSIVAGCCDEACSWAPG